MISKQKEGMAYVYVLFLISTIFTMIMVLLRISLLNAIVVENATSAVNLQAMSQEGIVQGLAVINDDIHDNLDEILLIEIVNIDNIDDEIVKNTVKFIQDDNFTFSQNDYTVDVEISYNLDWKMLQVRSLATKTDVYSSVELIAIVNIDVESDVIEHGDSLEIRFITPPKAVIYTTYEQFD